MRWLQDVRQYQPSTVSRPLSVVVSFYSSRGQMLQTTAGTWVQVTAIQRWTATATVDNLTVANTHTV